MQSEKWTRAWRSVSQCIKPIRGALRGTVSRPIIAIPFHCRNWSRPNDPQALVNSGGVVSAVNNWNINGPMNLSDARPRGGSVRASFVEERGPHPVSAPRYLPVERISSDMNCHELNNACICINVIHFTE